MYRSYRYVLGLSLTMFINQAQYVPVLTPEAGVHAPLHRQRHAPLMDEEGFDVSPGTKTGISIRYVSMS